MLQELQMQPFYILSLYCAANAIPFYILWFYIVLQMQSLVTFYIVLHAHCPLH